MKHGISFFYFVIASLSFALYSMDQQLCTRDDFINLTEQGKSALNNFITLVKEHDKKVDEKNKSTYIEGFSLPTDNNSPEEPTFLIGNSAGEIIINGLSPVTLQWITLDNPVKHTYSTSTYSITQELIYNKYHSCFTLLALYAKLHADATEYSTTFNTIKEKHDRYFKWADVLAPFLGTLALMTGWFFWIIKYPTQAKTAFFGCGAAAAGLWIYCRAWWAPSLNKERASAVQKQQNFVVALYQLIEDIKTHPGIVYSNAPQYENSTNQRTSNSRYSNVYLFGLNKNPFYPTSNNTSARDFFVGRMNKEIEDSQFKNEGMPSLLYALQHGILLP